MRENPDSTLPNRPEADDIWEVSTLATSLKEVVEENFSSVRLRAEIGRVSRPASGHLYLDLKDARAVLNAVIWRQQAATLAVMPEEGLEVICRGRLTIFPGQSRYQLIIESLAPAGAGALMAMLAARRKKLAAEGLFDASRKQVLPFAPAVIGVITSASGAVIRDILHRISERWPSRVLVWPVAVQGERSAAEVQAAIEGFNQFGGSLPRPDILIIARGGGALEDLMGFNEENLVRAAAASAIPLISAIGHETDHTLLDEAADMRAPTPTAAAELATPVAQQLRQRLGELALRMEAGIAQRAENEARQLRQLARVLGRGSELAGFAQQRLDALSARFSGAMRQGNLVGQGRLTSASIGLVPALLLGNIDQRAAHLAAKAALGERRLFELLTRHESKTASLWALLRSLDYRKILARGFALLRAKEKILRSAEEARDAGRFEIEFAEGQRLAAQALDAPPAKARRKKPPVSGQGELL